MPELAAAYVIILSAMAVEQDLDFQAFGANACIAKGPFKEVERHILAVFASIDRGEADLISKDIIGTEGVFKRVATQELLSVKRHFDATLAHMHEGFLELTPTAQIVCANHAATVLLGQTEEKIISTYLYDFFDEANAAQLREGFAGLEAQPISLGEVRPLQLRDIYLAMTLFCVFEQGQKSVIAIFQDISDRKRAEQELRLHREHLEELVQQRTAEISAQHQQLVQEMQRRRALEAEKQKLEVALRQTHKMEALGTLAAGIAHDFNNILTAVIGFTELNQLEARDNPALYSNLEQVKMAGHRARDLIKNILTFSRKREQEFQPIMIHAVLKEAVKLLRASARANITIREAIDSNCGAILADATQVHQIIMNLCTNAFHAMKDTGGVLEVRLERVELPRPTADVVPAPMMQFVKLSVKDTGVGIDPATLEKIFDPYFTTKAPGEGTGMGLAVVHGIVASHGGEVAVASTPGVGSTFTALFPELPIALVRVLAADSRVMRGTELILVVDDDQSILLSTRKILQALGYQVDTAGNGDEAMAIFAAHDGKFDLVIIDEEMPGLPGTELAAKLLALRPDLPIILCTGYGNILSAEQIQGLGIKDLLLKPFYFPELAAAVRGGLDR
jgi:PAS domain S-box-containing protein